MSVVRGAPDTEGQVLVGLANGDFYTATLMAGGSVQRIFSASTSSTTVEPWSCLQVEDAPPSSPPEFMLAYNRVTSFRASNGEQTRPFQINWHTRPHALAYVYPYLLAFTTSTLDVATLINGNLVKSLPMPNVRFLTTKNDVFFTTAQQSSTGASHAAIYRIGRVRLCGVERCCS